MIRADSAGLLLKSTDNASISVRNAFDLIQRNGVVATIVKARGAGRFVTGHLLGDFQFAAVLQIRGDAGRSETVTGYLGSNTGGQCSALDHQIDLGLRKGGTARKFSVAEGREEGTPRLCGKPRKGEPLIQKLLQPGCDGMEVL